MKVTTTSAAKTKIIITTITAAAIMTNLSKKIFKSKLKIQLFHVLENEDVYIDFHTLLTKMSNIQNPNK